MSSNSVDTQVVSNNSNHSLGRTTMNRSDNHNSLVGSERLFSLVHCLGQSCPWTASVDALTMLSWLSSEVKELKHEIQNNNQEEMISELGDILFDTLMLEMICRQTFQFPKEKAWQVAAEKVERRTPYMKEWGDGVSIARTPEEAEVLWQAAKANERTNKKKGKRKEKKKSTHDQTKFTRSSRAVLEFVDTKIVSAAAVGFLLGMCVSNLASRKR